MPYRRTTSFSLTGFPLGYNTILEGILIKPGMPDKIKIDNGIFCFKGKYNFLSNFYTRVNFWYHDLRYSCVENAFQAAKTDDISVKKTFSCDGNLSPVDAKRKGRALLLPDNWDMIKDDIMYEILYCKFSQNKTMLLQLIDLSPYYLVEGNTWNDKYWGAVFELGYNTILEGHWVGENMLGILLMRLRDEFITDGTFI